MILFRSQPFWRGKPDLVHAAAAATARKNHVINVKKPQFIAPEDVIHIVKKCEEAGSQNVLLTDAGRRSATGGW